jgi:hypothetical protein
MRKRLLALVLVATAAGQASNMTHFVAGSGVIDVEQCITACAELDGFPACLTPDLNISALVGLGHAAWLGVHREAANGAADGGEFTRCFDGSTPNFTSSDIAPLAVGFPNTASYGGCAAVWLDGLMYELPCTTAYRPGYLFELRCLCSKPAVDEWASGPDGGLPSAEMPEDERAWLDGWKEADLERRAGYLLPSIIVGGTLLLLPWMIYIVALLVRCATRRSVGAEDAKTRRLRECQQRAARVRRRVKLTLAAAAWLLMCIYLTYDIAPLVLSGGKAKCSLRGGRIPTDSSSSRLRSRSGS